MFILDLCAGTGSSTQAFLDKGHRVVGVELVPFKAKSPPWVLEGDVLEVAKDPIGWLRSAVQGDQIPDHLHASPPCDPFAVPSISTHWEDTGYGGLVPKTDKARMGLRLVEAVATIIQKLKEANPNLTFTVENPRAKMRVVVEKHHAWMGPPKEAMYCRYGPIGPVPVAHGPPMVYAMKATDFWSNLDWTPRYCDVKMGKNAKIVTKDGLEFVCRKDGTPCHERASRSWKTGVQRIKGAGDRAKFPTALSQEICERTEAAHGKKTEPKEQPAPSTAPVPVTVGSGHVVLLPSVEAIAADSHTGDPFRDPTDFTVCPTCKEPQQETSWCPFCGYTAIPVMLRLKGPNITVGDVLVNANPDGIAEQGIPAFSTRSKTFHFNERENRYGDAFVVIEGFERYDRILNWVGAVQAALQRIVDDAKGTKVPKTLTQAIADAADLLAHKEPIGKETG